MSLRGYETEGKLQDKILRWSAGIAVVLLVLSFLIPNASWVIGWHNAYGTTWDVTQVHAVCASPVVQAAQTISGPIARCSAADAWYDACGLLRIAAIISALVFVYRSYRLRHPHTRPQHSA